MKKFGERIREARVCRGLDLGELAAMVGMTKSYVCAIELGSQAPPSPKFVRKFSRVLGLPAQEMLALALWEKRDPSLTRAAMIRFLKAI